MSASSPIEPKVSSSPSPSTLSHTSSNGQPNGHSHENGNGNSLDRTHSDHHDHGHTVNMVTTTTTTTRTQVISTCEDDDALISTPSGMVRVSPYIKNGHAEFRSALSFVPRYSSFDRENVKSQNDQFRGFFTLFWIDFLFAAALTSLSITVASRLATTMRDSLALMFVRTSMESWNLNRTLLSPNFGRLITRDGAVLAFADFIMVSSMLLCVPFVKCLQKGYFSYYWTGCIMQHLFQTTFLFVAVAWGYARDWYWVQAGFLVLHALSSLMKMHSYMAHNGMLSTVYARLQKERRTLDAYVKSLDGGFDKALKEAAARQANLKAIEDAAPPVSVPSSVPDTPTIIVTDDEAKESGQLGRKLADEMYRNGPKPFTLDGSVLRQRKKTRPSHQAIDKLPAPADDLPKGTSLEPSHAKTPHQECDPAQLSWSPDPRIALLARNIDAMESELRSNGAKGVVWPNTVTYRNFIEFMFFPTLVYELEYPRTTTMRPLYIFEKVIATFGTFSLIYTVTEHYIMPYTPKPGDSLFHTFFKLALPMMTNFLLIFYIIFECVCTGFAELSYFADREFYQDWWNSTSWDQFSRKWNKPVHTFLLRHVYASTMKGWRLSRWGATIVTFLLSALCHELVMAVVSKKIRPYLFLLQMVQLPLVALSRVPIIKRNRTLGNIVFWIGLMAGFPLLEICYLLY